MIKYIKHIITSAMLVAMSLITYAQEKDSVTSAPYPRRLITDFPNIYCDTIYTNHKCFIVARAVWKTNRKHPVKVTGNTLSLLPIDSSKVVSFKEPPAKQNKTKAHPKTKSTTCK